MTQKTLEHYQGLSKKYFEEAKEFLNKGNLAQTSERLWGASALAVKAIAAKRGIKIEKHGSLWDFLTKLSKERKDESLITLSIMANGLHRNFYENQMNRESLEVAIRNVEELIARLTTIL